MKINLKFFTTLITLSLLLYGVAFAQRASRVRPEVRQARTYAGYSIMNPSNTSIGLTVDESIDKAVQIFGQPSSITHEEFEMDEVTAKVYHYGNNKIYFVADKLDSWDLKDNSIVVGQPASQYLFKIGDKTAIPSGGTTYAFLDFIPMPVVYKKDGDAGRKFFKGFMKRTEALDSIIDDFVILEFNSSNELVRITLSRQ